MNVLSPPHPTTAPTASATPSASASADAPTGFGRLLADQVGSTSGHVATPSSSGDTPASASLDPAEAAEPSTTPETPSGEGGAVAAAVQGAIAAWRADPDDVALGVHLRQTLEGTVRQLADSRPTSGPTSPAAPATAKEASAGTALASVATPAEGTPTSVDGGVGSGPVPDVPTTIADGPITATTSQPTAATVAPSTDGRPAPTPATSDAGRAATAAMPASAEGATTTGEPAIDAPRPIETRAPARGQAPEPPTPAPAGHDTSAETAEIAATTRSETSAPASRTDGPSVTSSATLDRVLRAVEALEHAPPPRRLSIEVEGVQLTVAMQGEEVTVAVRTGADQLAPGWQRDLASALRWRGLDLAADAGSTSEQGEGRRHAPTRDHEPGSPARTRPHRPPHAAEPAGLHL